MLHDIALLIGLTADTLCVCVGTLSSIASARVRCGNKFTNYYLERIMNVEVTLTQLQIFC